MENHPQEKTDEEGERQEDEGKKMDMCLNSLTLTEMTYPAIGCCKKTLDTTTISDKRQANVRKRNDIENHHPKKTDEDKKGKKMKARSWTCA